MQGLKVECLAGNKQWALTENREIPIRICDQALVYNQSVMPDQRFSGLHFDIEPHTLGNIWRQDTSKGKDRYNDSLENNLLWIFQTCCQKINQSGQTVILSADIGTDYAQYVTDLIEPLLGQQSPLDYVTIMNYFDQYETLME